MAGAVNLRTKSRITAPELTLAAEAASFQEFRAAVSGGVPFTEQGNMGLVGYAEAQTTQGNYPFRFNEFGRDTTLERVNADAHFFAASLLGFAQIERWRLQGRVLTRFAERGTPGAVVQGSVEMARARLGEEDVLASFTANNAFTNQSLLTLLASAKFNTLHYRDPDARQFGANGINERFVAQDWSASAKLHFDETVNSPFLALSHEFLLETTVSDLRGNMLQRDVGNRVQRVNIGFAAKGELRVQLGKTTMFNELRMNAALRADSFSDVGNALSPLLGAAWVLDSIWTVRAQWSYNFRPPAFNELYYLNFGNTRLKPERADCWNVGVSFQHPSFLSTNLLQSASILSFASDIFYHRTENQIIAVQTSPFTVSAQNIEQVQTLGWEASLQAAFWENFSFQMNYTFQRATNETPSAFTRGKQLVYTPEHLASAVVNYKESWFQAGCTAQYVGNRYSLPANSADARLPAFFTLNCFAEATARIAQTPVRMRLQCDNVFDERYAVIRNFPMPARAVRATAEVKF
jgi:outer membrane receptor protein involved in Fe transport